MSRQYHYLYSWVVHGKGLALDTFYEISPDVLSSNETDLLSVIDPEGARKMRVIHHNISAMHLRARYSMANGLCKVISPVELTFEQWETFLDQEYRRNPESKFLKPIVR